VSTSTGVQRADVVVFNGDAPSPRERSLSGFALLIGLRGRDRSRAHHEIRFPADYDAEFDDVFVARRPVADPTLYLAASWVSDDGEAPADGENLFVLANAPSGGVDWAAQGPRYEAALLERLGLERERVAFVVRRTPADLERETGALGGAIYGVAPHGRLGTLRRPPNAVTGVRGLWRVGGTTHPGGGLPLVLLSGRTVAGQIDPAAARLGCSSAGNRAG
jgi:phytoene dehydrogenase-like protein